jgi:hypothetical protein
MRRAKVVFLTDTELERAAAAVSALNRSVLVELPDNRVEDRLIYDARCVLPAPEMIVGIAGFLFAAEQDGTGVVYSVIGVSPSRIPILRLHRGDGTRNTDFDGQRELLFALSDMKRRMPGNPLTEKFAFASDIPRLVMMLLILCEWADWHLAQPRP